MAVTDQEFEALSNQVMQVRLRTRTLERCLILLVERLHERSLFDKETQQILGKIRKILNVDDTKRANLQIRNSDLRSIEPEQTELEKSIL